MIVDNGILTPISRISIIIPFLISLSSHGIQANAQEEINLLKGRCLMLESINPTCTHDSENVVESDDILRDESIILAGGSDGNNWLSALDLYSLLSDVLKPLKPMTSFWSYFAIANLSREVYVFGGKFEKLWDDTGNASSPCLHIPSSPFLFSC